MHISVLTVFAELYAPFLATSLIRRAQEQRILTIDVAEFFSFVAPKERIDAPIFGHGAGMLVKPLVVQRAIEQREAVAGKAFKIFLSPQGRKLNQNLVREIAEKSLAAGHMLIVAGRYEGMDARVEEEYADMTVSLGDFVLLGGDIAALALLEATVRLVPSVVGKQESVDDESFAGGFVEYPHYTEPVVWKDRSVPDIVRSGNHGALDEWRMKEAASRTVMHHFDWLRQQVLTERERFFAASAMPPHYTALLHNDVLIGSEKKPGTTSVTSIDIHDIARSSKTYGIKNFFIVTHLVDQQKIVEKLLDFWMSTGIEYNRERHEAVRHVRLAHNLDMVIDRITELEGKRPLVIATSARDVEHVQNITFDEQSRIWETGRPVLLVFGTGRGLAESIIDRSDFLLKPVRALTEYNHLSVRSAVAIVLDRWLGVQ